MSDAPEHDDKPKPTKVLVLHIEVPGVWADDLPESAGYLADDGVEPTAQDYLDVVTEEWMREEVGLTIVTLPGEKNMNEDFEVHAYTARIVGAGVRDVRQ
jgi:hypothetical protein